MIHPRNPAGVPSSQLAALHIRKRAHGKLARGINHPLAGARPLPAFCGCGYNVRLSAFRARFVVGLHCVGGFKNIASGVHPKALRQVKHGKILATGKRKARNLRATLSDIQLIRVRNVIQIETRDIQHFKRGAPLEHAAHIRGAGGLKRRQVQLGKRGAIIEHAEETGHLCRAEGRNVNRGQSRAFREHVAHIRRICRVEVRQIKRGQGFAVAERGKEAGQLGRIKR